MVQLARLAAGTLAGVALLSAAKPLPRHPITLTSPVAAPRATGLTFKYRITSSAQDKKQREARSLFATVRIAEGNVRMDYLEGMTPMGKKGGYMVMKGDPAQFIMVDPNEKQAMIMSAELMGSGLGAMANNPMLKIAFSDQSFRYQDQGAGETILGYKTRKVRTVYTSTVETKVLMMNTKVTTTDTSDQWIATGIKMDPGSMERWSKSFASGVKSTNPELAAQMAKYQEEYGRTGMALKSVTYSTAVDKKGKATVDTLTMEVTELQNGPIDMSIFDVPSDYKVTDLSQMAAGMKASMDSAAKADEDKDSKKDEKKKEEKPSAKDALKSGLGGLLKKKPPM
jgi:hypothetical protein